jgi:hypothetical protein
MIANILHAYRMLYLRQEKSLRDHGAGRVPRDSACGPRAAGFRQSTAGCGCLGLATRDAGSWPGFAWPGVTRICGFSGKSRACVWYAGMSEGGANLRLHPETGLPILLRRAGDARRTLEGEEIKMSVSPAPELDSRVRESAHERPGSQRGCADRDAAGVRGGREQGLGHRLLNETGLTAGRGRRSGGRPEPSRIGAERRRGDRCGSG